MTQNQTSLPEPTQQASNAAIKPEVTALPKRPPRRARAQVNFSSLGPTPTAATAEPVEKAETVDPRPASAEDTSASNPPAQKVETPSGDYRKYRRGSAVNFWIPEDLKERLTAIENRRAEAEGRRPSLSGLMREALAEVADRLENEQP